MVWLFFVVLCIVVVVRICSYHGCVCSVIFVNMCFVVWIFFKGYFVNYIFS